MVSWSAACCVSTGAGDEKGAGRRCLLLPDDATHLIPWLELERERERRLG